MLGASNRRGVRRRALEDETDGMIAHFAGLERLQHALGWTLSGGQLQMVAVARGLMARPEAAAAGRAVARAGAADRAAGVPHRGGHPGRAARRCCWWSRTRTWRCPWRTGATCWKPGGCWCPDARRRCGRMTRCGRPTWAGGAGWAWSTERVADRLGCLPIVKGCSGSIRILDITVSREDAGEAYAAGGGCAFHLRCCLPRTRLPGCRGSKPQLVSEAVTSLS